MRGRSLLSILSVIPALCVAQTTPAVDYRVVNVQQLTPNGGRVAWSTAPLNLIAYDALSSDGFYDIWTMNPDGSNQLCLTCGKTNAPAFNKGNPDWHPSGAYLAMQAQRTDTTYLDDTTSVSRPGVGADNVIYIMDAQGDNYWEVPASATYTPHFGGVLHPHFSHDGTKLIWAQQTSHLPEPSGTWEIQVASFALPTAPGGEPQVTLLQTLQPGITPAILETHGFSLDDSTIFLSGTASGQQQYGLDIYSYNLNTGAFANLTNTDDNWDEHSRPSPVEEKLLFMSTYGNPGSSITNLLQDYWTMNYDGTDKKRVTWFQDPASSYYLQGFTAGDNDWSPDGTQAVVYMVDVSSGTSLGLPGAIYLLTFAASSTATSAASYYNFPQAPGAIVSSFGANLAAASGDRASTVSITDSRNVSYMAATTFESPNQVNWLVPAGAALGPATVSFTSPAGVVQDSVAIENVGPGIFSIDSTGSGAAAAFVNVYPADGSAPTSQPVFNCPGAGQTCTAAPVSLAGGQPFLILFGTGIAKHQSPVEAVIGNQTAPYWAGMNVSGANQLTVTASYAGAQGGYAGLDQVNIPLPASLAGGGTMYVQVQVDGYWSNTVQVQFQ